jgi:hypothetical protein
MRVRIRNTVKGWTLQEVFIGPETVLTIVRFLRAKEFDQRRTDDGFASSAGRARLAELKLETSLPPKGSFVRRPPDEFALPILSRSFVVFFAFGLRTHRSRNWER